MKTIQNNQCPNCWGFQEYDNKQTDNKICNCNNNKIKQQQQ
ncbi:hypothetical protein [Olleya sp. R77988]